MSGQKLVVAIQNKVLKRINKKKKKKEKEKFSSEYKLTKKVKSS